MAERNPPRPLLLIVAAIYLVEAWFWARFVALGRRVADALPWEAFKAAVKRGIDRLPAPAALAVFVVPVILVEPLKVLCIALFAHGHWILGLIGFVVLKFVGLALIAFVFDLTREKLMTMGWFVVFYGRVMAFHAWAHALVEPYKARILEAAATVTATLRATWGRWIGA
jgi:hypothetical protein